MAFDEDNNENTNKDDAVMPPESEDHKEDHIQYNAEREAIQRGNN